MIVRSISASCSRETGSKCGKSNRRRPGCTERAGLLGVLAEHLLHGRVEDVGGRVAARGRDAPRAVDDGLDGLALGDLAGDDPGAVDDQPLDRPLGVEHLETTGRGREHAAVADLPTTLGVERGAGQDDLDLVALLGVVVQPAGRDDRPELGLGLSVS